MRMRIQNMAAFAACRLKSEIKKSHNMGNIVRQHKYDSTANGEVIAVKGNTIESAVCFVVSTALYHKRCLQLKLQGYEKNVMI